jgi:hypothetical protein
MRLVCSELRKIRCEPVFLGRQSSQAPAFLGQARPVGGVVHVRQPQHDWRKPWTRWAARCRAMRSREEEVRVEMRYTQRIAGPRPSTLFRSYYFVRGIY